MPLFEHENVKMFYETQGDDAKPVIVWAHGWRQSHAAWAQMIAPFREQFHHIAVDFPGFGQSDFPPANWGVPEYTDFMAAFIKQQGFKTPVIWIGHSFGCRVGLQMAVRHPELVKGLFLIGGAGLRRKRGLWENIVLYSKIYTFKACKKLLVLGLSENWLKSRFGSPDYRAAPADFRPVMMRVNADDLTALVPSIACPVGLVYGSNDRETPPEIGYRLEKLIPHAVMHELPDQDHYTVLAGGRHQVLGILKDFILGLR